MAPLAPATMILIDATLARADEHEARGRRLGYSTAMPDGEVSTPTDRRGKPAIATRPTTPGVTVIGSSTQGIKTVVHSSSDPATTKEVRRNG
jgi:hypothetical protein